MKKIKLLVTLLLLSCNKPIAQTTDVVTGLEGPIEMALHGNDLYFVETTGDRISKIDITLNTPTADIVIDKFTPTAIALKGNDLYVGYLNNISKINLNAVTPTVELVITVPELSRPYGMVFNGNDLYVADNGNGTDFAKIYKVDLSSSTPTAEIIVDVDGGLEGPYKILLNGNDLYISETTGNKISKIDITASTPTPTDVVTGLNRPIGMALNGNDLYIAEVTGNKISKIDISATIPTTPTEVTTGLLEAPFAFLINSNDLYIAETNGNKISKFNMGTLSTNENSTVSDVKLHPNPTSDFIEISGLTETENYTLHNISGAKINSGIISVNEKIDIKKLINGVYFLRFENGNSIKFIKE